MFQVPQELIQESKVSATGRAIPETSKPAIPAAPPAAPSPPPTPPQAPVGDRTVVAQIPQELLSQSAQTQNLQAAEEAHFREVYHQFIETRRQCGEETADLTYDRFVAKLLKNREQIVEKYNSKSVRFQVYVKQGKAALRAVPVRE